MVRPAIPRAIGSGDNMAVLSVRAFRTPGGHRGWWAYFIGEGQRRRLLRRLTRRQMPNQGCRDLLSGIKWSGYSVFHSWNALQVRGNGGQILLGDASVSFRMYPGWQQSTV